MEASLLNADERLALLLRVMGNEASNQVLAAVDPGRAGRLRSAMQAFQDDPPSDEEIDFALEDFTRFFRFAKEQIEAQNQQASQAETANNGNDSKNASGDVSSQSEDGENVAKLPSFAPSQNAKSDLKKLDPYQIARALMDDHPKTIAMVLSFVDATLAASVMKELPEAVRPQIFLLLNQPVTLAPVLIDRVLRTTVEKALKITARPKEVSDAERLADTLRALPKAMRVTILEQMAETDAELVERIKTSLYRWEDMLRIEGRQMQRLMGNVDSASLVVALQKADSVLVDTIFKSISKRAAESIKEEMEFKSSSTEAEINAARQSIVEVMARMDEAGEINLE
jgi:flagellar motor switch protein FliG